jgi:hypothetical protein
LLVEADSADGDQNLHVLQPDLAGSNLQAITFYPDLSPFNQRYFPSNPVWLPDAADGSARVAYFERWVQGADPFTDLNDNGQWDPGEPYTDANGDGAYTPFEELAFELRVVTLGSGDWPLVEVVSNDPLPWVSALPVDVNRPSFLYWNQTQTEVAWQNDGPGFWLAPVLYDENGNPGIDWGLAELLTPSTPLGGFGAVTFSPDGGRLAFIDYAAANAFLFHIYAINADGSQLKDLTRSGSGTWGEFYGPSWGPIGSGD